MSTLLTKAKRRLHRMLPNRAKVEDLVRQGLTQKEARSWLDQESPYPRTIVIPDQSGDDKPRLRSKGNETRFLVKYSKPIARVIMGVVLTGLVLVAAGLYLTTRTVNTTLTNHVIIASDSPNCIELPNVLPEGSIITISQPSRDTIIAILPIGSLKILTESGTLTTLNILKQSTMPFRAQSPVFIFNVANRNQYVACVLTNSSIPIASDNTFTVSVYPDRTLGNAMWLSGGGLILAVRGTLGLAGVGRVVDFYRHKVWKETSTAT